MVKDQSQQKPISQIMASGGGGYMPYATNHDGWEIDRFTPVHRIHKALIHCVNLIFVLTSGSHILNDKPKEQLVKWQHVTLLYSHRVFQP